jgi:hypothetical protein
MTAAQIVRYSRHVLLREVGGRGQQRLLEGRVRLAGAGRASEVALLYLSAAGVGRIEVDAGLAPAAIAHARAQNPEAEVTPGGSEGLEVICVQADDSSAVTAGARAALAALRPLLGIGP